jgi:hypothetical protein
MSSAGGTHEAVVATWMDQAERVTSAQLVDLFEAGIQRVLQRAQPTLGQATLGAIVDRVLFTACERFPFLAPLQLKTGNSDRIDHWGQRSLDFDDLRTESSAIAPDELANATRFAMVEFLTVLGHLTAEILTPALHAELSMDRHTPGPTKPRTRKTNT